MRVQHTFNAKSGLAEDAIVNTFHFTGANDANATQGAILSDLIESFYDDVPLANTSPIGTWLAAKSLAAAGKHSFKCYDMEEPKVRVPKFQITTTGIAYGAPDPLPAEVALCLSYRAAQISGSNPKRERGRIYIGPFHVSTHFVDQSGYSRPDPSVRKSLLNAGKKLQDDAAAAGWAWVVYSPTQAAGAVGPNGGEFGTAAVAEVLVDDAWDTQRRRGPRRLARESMFV